MERDYTARQAPWFVATMYELLENSLYKWQFAWAFLFPFYNEKPAGRGKHYPPSITLFSPVVRENIQKVMKLFEDNDTDINQFIKKAAETLLGTERFHEIEKQAEKSSYRKEFFDKPFFFVSAFYSCSEREEKRTQTAALYSETIRYFANVLRLLLTRDEADKTFNDKRTGVQESFLTQSYKAEHTDCSAQERLAMLLFDMLLKDAFEFILNSGENKQDSKKSEEWENARSRAFLQRPEKPGINEVVLHQNDGSFVPEEILSVFIRRSTQADLSYDEMTALAKWMAGQGITSGELLWEPLISAIQRKAIAGASEEMQRKNFPEAKRWMDLCELIEKSSL